MDIMIILKIEPKEQKMKIIPHFQGKGANIKAKGANIETEPKHSKCVE